MEIPDYLTKTYSLNEVATLQYMNSNKEAYVIVIEDSKELLESLGTKFVDSKDFLDNFTSTFHKDDKNRTLGSVSQFTANNNKHSQVEMTWENDGLNFYMIITGVETPTHFYKIMTWTISENKDLLKSDFLRISKSLKD
ncbi:hypothetical protein GVN16_20225 [Emticicia sp. CRIBPO]|nr:hypothetical protein [Emticicia sp. CRIBPO]